MMNTLKFRPDFIPSVSAREADQPCAASQVFQESMEMPGIRKRSAENIPGSFVWPIPGYVWLASAKTVTLPSMIPEADFEDPDDMKIVALDADRREQAAEGWFQSAITLTIPAILRLPKLVV